MNKNIEFNVCGIAEVLKNYRLKVPPNQREFSWESDQVTELLQDIGNAMREKAPSYFLGTIVLTKSDSGDYFEVADGQQRLATTTIILSHFRDIFSEREREDDMRVQSIENDFLFTIDMEVKEKLPKLTLNIDDNEYYFNTVLERPDKRKEVRATYISHNLIDNAKREVRGYFDGAAKQVGDSNFISYVLEWYKYIQTSASVVVLRVIDAANAFVMFETLNDRGLKTSQADLVKNYLFQKSGDRLAEAQGYWSSIRGAIESVSDIDLIMEYLRLGCCVLSGTTREKDVMDRITKLAPSKSDAIRLLHTFGDMAADYAAILNPDHSKWNTYNPDVRNSIKSIIILGVKQIRPLMLSLAQKFDEINTDNAFKMMVSWSVRFLVEGVRGGRLDEGYSKLANEVYQGKLTDCNSLRSAASSFVPSDSQFKSSFETARVSVAKLARFYLRSMEITARGESVPEFIPNPNVIINLEHIMPQSLSEEWPAIRQQDIETHASRIGNLALLQFDKNGKIGASSFATKKETFRESRFLLTSKIADLGSWGTMEIENRQKSLADIAVRTWPI